MKALQFSGGLDSLACLELLKDTKGLIVLTATTDGEYPERQAYLKKVELAHPHLEFVQVYGDRRLSHYGHPVDVVPTKFTLLGGATQSAPVRYQSHLECCNRGLWQPLAIAVYKLGITELYRGQRLSDDYKAPLDDGYTENGVTYRFPINSWSRDDVWKYVTEHCPDLIPAYYGKEKTSRDCWDCTAYLSENMSRIRNLPFEQYIQVSTILSTWREDVKQETRW
jgi:3'-phosphoadenosine 5'-phosphosulfate sulfotransferase (PAPS reductase)/FAD synthetase